MAPSRAERLARTQRGWEASGSQVHPAFRPALPCLLPGPWELPEPDSWCPGLDTAARPRHPCPTPQSPLQAVLPLQGPRQGSDRWEPVRRRPAPARASRQGHRASLAPLANTLTPGGAHVWRPVDTPSRGCRGPTTSLKARGAGRQWPQPSGLRKGGAVDSLAET